jgi:hypothetical protein
VFLPFTSHHQLQACFFSLAKSRQKEKLKTKIFENENGFEGFFQINRSKSQIKIKLKTKIAR